MKRFLLSFIALIAISCNSDDESCQEKRDKLNAEYDRQIRDLTENPGPTGVNQTQIALINKERSERVARACK